MNPPKNPDDNPSPAASARVPLRIRLYPYLLLLCSTIAAADLIYVALVYPRDVQPGALTIAAGAVLTVNGFIAARNSGRNG